MELNDFPRKTFIPIILNQEDCITNSLIVGALF